MNFLIADTFTDSLARLTGDEQKAVKTTAFDLQMNPSAPGLSFHKLDKAKDKRFWSVRVNSDVRLREFDVAGLLVRMQAREDSVAGAEVGMSHVRAFDGTVHAERDIAEIVGAHQ